MVDDFSRSYSQIDPSFTSSDMPSFLRPEAYTRTMSISELLDQSKALTPAHINNRDCQVQRP